MARTSGLVISGIVLGSCLSVAAWAFPAAPVNTGAASNVILAADKCGKGNHKDEHGHCMKDDRDHCAAGRHWHEGHGRCEK